MKAPNFYHITPRALELLLWHKNAGFRPENDFQNRLYEISVVFHSKDKPCYTTKELVCYDELMDDLKFIETHTFRSSVLIESVCASRLKFIYEHEFSKR